MRRGLRNRTGIGTALDPRFAPAGAGNPSAVAEVKEDLERAARKTARGRSEETPVIVHHVLFLGIGAFVGLLVLTILLIYYLV